MMLHAVTKWSETGFWGVAWLHEKKNILLKALRFTNMVRLWKDFKSLILIHRDTYLLKCLSNSGELGPGWLMSVFDLSSTEDARLLSLYAWYNFASGGWETSSLGFLKPQASWQLTGSYCIPTWGPALSLFTVFCNNILGVEFQDRGESRAPVPWSTLAWDLAMSRK